jgi:hypothetical protein
VTVRAFGRTYGLALVAACLVGVPIVAEAKKISYQARYKAKYPAVAEGKTVGVLNFDGADGSNFGAALSAQLQSASLDEQPLFAVKTLDSMNYVSDGSISKAEVAAALRLGQKLGVKTIFTGTVMSASTTKTDYTREDSVCADSDGLFKCKRLETRRVPCTKVVGQYSVSPRAIAVPSGTVTYSEVISRQGEYSTCNGQLQSGNINFLGLNLGGKKQTPADVTSPDALLNRLRTEAAVLVRQQVAPYNQPLDVELKETAKGLAKPEAEQFSNAIAFGNAARMDRACSIFETLGANPANANNVNLLYNLGVCQEVLLPDEPGAALEYYAKADQFLSKPDKMVSDAYLRTKKLVGEKRGIGQ